MKQQLIPIYCFIILTSTGAFVSVQRPFRASSAVSARASKSLRDDSVDDKGLIRKFFSSSDKEEKPEADAAEDRNNWSLGFFRRNRDSDTPIEAQEAKTAKRPIDRKREDAKRLENKKQQQIEIRQEQRLTEKKNQRKEQKQTLKKEETTEGSSVAQARNFVSGFFSGDRNQTKEEKQSKKEETTDESSFAQARNFLSGLFAGSDDNDDENKKKEPENTIRSVFSSVQRFVGGAFTSDNQEQWVPVFPKTRLSPGEIVPVTIGGIDLLVIASKDGRKLYCIANSCSHLGTPLETGKIVRMPVEGPEEIDDDTNRRQPFTETEVSAILQQDGLEDCIVCPLHRTAFALKSGQVRGEWCPYPPIVGKLVGSIKQPTGVATFDIRTKGKLIEVRINSLLDEQQSETSTKE